MNAGKAGVRHQSAELEQERLHDRGVDAISYRGPGDCHRGYWLDGEPLCRAWASPSAGGPCRIRPWSAIMNFSQGHRCFSFRPSSHFLLPINSHPANMYMIPANLFAVLRLFNRCVPIRGYVLDHLPPSARPAYVEPVHLSARSQTEMNPWVVMRKIAAAVAHRLGLAAAAVLDSDLCPDAIPIPRLAS